MATAPNTDNYSLGKGVIYFDEKGSNGLYKGERDLGNAPAFSFNIALEKLDHFSSRGGLKAKDKQIISQITPGVTFTLDELNKENLAMLSLADIIEVTQVAGSAVAETVIGHPGKRSQLAHRNVGTMKITHGTVTAGPFVVGNVITQATSLATGSIVAVGSGFIQVAVASGTFSTTTAVLTATQGTAGSATTANAPASATVAPVFVPGVIAVTGTAGTPVYVQGTDYVVNEDLKDATIGRIMIIDIANGGTIAEGTELKVTYGYAASTYTTIQAFKNTQMEGKLRFVSDNPVGTQMELQVWRCSLAPDGDTSMIGDDWSTLGFTGEILKDEVGHPDSPYMEFTIA
jgi:hypothetical protein